MGKTPNFNGQKLWAQESICFAKRETLGMSLLEKVAGAHLCLADLIYVHVILLYSVINYTPAVKTFV
jgi:hypothetical protein